MPWFYVDRTIPRSARGFESRPISFTNTDILKRGKPKMRQGIEKDTASLAHQGCVACLGNPRPRAQDAKLTLLTSPCLTLFTKIVHQVVGVTEGVLDHEIEPQRVHQLILGFQQTFFVPVVLLVVKSARWMGETK